MQQQTGNGCLQNADGGIGRAGNGLANLLLGDGGGLYWLLAEIVTGLLVAAYYAWILLIEIRR